jgi:hypothetical protein
MSSEIERDQQTWTEARSITTGLGTTILAKTVEVEVLRGHQWRNHVGGSTCFIHWLSKMLPTMEEPKIYDEAERRQCERVDGERWKYGIKLWWEEARQLMLGMKNGVKMGCFIPSRPRPRSMELLPSSGLPGLAEGYCACSGIFLAMTLQA